jgi:trans-2,3-dihydro-3-hydroxyanthranilate isomerase
VKHRYYTLDVFTDRAFTGNQLAVFPDASRIPAELMQSIAREFNYSETVFVLPPENPAHARRLRIFTPGAELPFAGHPTIGTSHLLAATGAVPVSEGDNAFILEEGVGAIRIRVQVREGQVQFAQLAAARVPERLEGTVDGHAIAAALSLSADDVLDDGVGPAVFSCGVPFLFARLRDAGAVGRAKLDQSAWDRGLARRGINEVFFFSDRGASSELRARMFAPGFGIPEDPATGGAVAALAGYLVEQHKPAPGVAKWAVEQGVEMGRPSMLYLEADLTAEGITSVRVGGQSVIVMEGLMEIA